jgi:hypothetical protein
MGPNGGPAPKRTGRQTVGRNVTWNWTCVIALQITDPSSRQRGRPTWKIKKVIVGHINLTSGHLLQKGQDTKTNWSTDSVVIWLRLRNNWKHCCNWWHPQISCNSGCNPQKYSHTSSIHWSLMHYCKLNCRIDIVSWLMPRHGLRIGNRIYKYV